jgi:hypothetical protein
MASAALRWLCLLAAIWILAFVFDVAVGAHTSDAGRLSIAPNSSQTATSSSAADDEHTDASNQEECNEMSKRLPPEVLVAMTMEELRYLESTLCPSL